MELKHASISVVKCWTPHMMFQLFVADWSSNVFHALLHMCTQKTTEWRGRASEWRSQRWWGAGDIFDSSSQQDVWSGLTSAHDLHLLSLFFFFFPPGSFYSKSDVARAETHTNRPETHIHSSNNIQKKKTLASSFHLFTFTLTHTHTPSPSPTHPHPLSSQRHKDIFIFHKAQTLMKRRRHKYISMIFHIWLLPPLLWHTTAFSVSHKLSQWMRAMNTQDELCLMYFSDNCTFAKKKKKKPFNHRIQS